MKRVYTLPICTVTNEIGRFQPDLGRSIIRLTGVDAPQAADTLLRASQVRAAGCQIELSVSDHPQDEGREAAAPWISMIWFPLRGDWLLGNAATWRLAKKLHDSLWSVGIRLFLSAGNMPGLPEAIQFIAKALPALKELRLTAKARTGEQRLLLDELRTPLQAGLQAAQRANDAGWKCAVRCEGLPLCAVDTSDFCFFIGRSEREDEIPLNLDGSRCAPARPAYCCPCFEACPLASLGQCGDNAESSFWVPEASGNAPCKAGLYAMCGGDDERFFLSRYTEVIQRRWDIVLRSRLFGCEVLVPLRGAAQEYFLDHLSTGMTPEEILAFFRKQGLESSLFDSMLKGCVLA